MASPNDNVVYENSDYELLVTRASKYDRETLLTTSANEKKSARRTTNRGKNFFICKEHYMKGKWTWSPLNASCSSCIMYETREYLGNGTLPTGKEVLEYLIMLRASNNGLQVNNIHICAADLALRWIFCTVYPHSLTAIEKVILIMDE